MSSPEILERSGETGSPQPELMLASDYHRELLTKIPAAKNRLLVTTMAIREGELTDKLFDAMQSCATENEGVRVLLQADSMTYVTSPMGIHAWASLNREFERKRQAYLLPGPCHYQQPSWNPTALKMSG